ncbi:hypothetical protein HYT05_03160 [Candidatus Kaiserbacteria bacterium]|nr:hypothetical protein [Candidatus Kaiserbacteria bacterium]
MTKRFGEKITEGKTKKIYQHYPGEVLILSKDAVTAGNGARHEVIRGKGHLVNEFALRFFKVLNRYHIPNAFRRRRDSESFVAALCQMVKLEIVVRFESDPEGSYQKRHPTMPASHPFKKPVIELFLKTSQRKWEGRDLPCDDPLVEPVRTKSGKYGVFLPNVPLKDQPSSLFVITPGEMGLRKDSDMEVIRDLSLSAATAFREALASVRVKLIDFKMEVGYTPDGDLVIADLVSPDECRMVTDISKQGFRKGDSNEVVLAKYALAAALSHDFQ